MNVSSIPFPKLKIDITKTEFEIFSANFREINHEPIIKAIEDREEIKKALNVSSVLRRLGNEHFNEKDYNSAYYYYSKSIGLAPVDSTEYALGIANRSAVFFMLRKYEACLKDIEYVLQLDYPENKLYKIYARQTDCLLHLNQNLDAIKAWSNATNHVRQFKHAVDAKQSEELQNKILNVIRTSQLFNKVVAEVQYPKPILKDGENPKFLNASNAVELKSNITNGRYVVATDDIEQGDVLFVEEPYCAVRNFCYGVYCSNCLIFSAANIPCKSCVADTYCSVECREKAWEKAHKWECLGERKQLLSFKTRLILNILFEASRHNFNTVAEDASRYGNKKDNFAFIYKLVTNKDKMTTNEIALFTRHAIFLVLYLKKFTDYFVWLHSQPVHANKPIDELYDFVGGLILKLAQQIFCNCTEIYDIDLISVSVELDVSLIGCGLYASTSMVNHSCRPNALASFNNTTRVIRATQNIPKNTEITIDYTKYRDDDQTALEVICFAHFKFNCICAKCKNRNGIKNERTPWLCNKCRDKAYPLSNGKYAKCINPSCKHTFNLRDCKMMELILAPNLVAACMTENNEAIDNMYEVMKKIYHKENVKFVGYYLASYSLHFDARDVVKTVQISKEFVEFTEQFHEILDFKLQASRRLSASLMLMYVVLRLRHDPNAEAVFQDLNASLTKTKKLLAYYVPPNVVYNYDRHMADFLKNISPPA